VTANRSWDIRNIPEHSVTLLEVLDTTADLSYLSGDISSKDERIVLDVEARVLNLPINRIDRESLVLDDDILLSSLWVRCLFDLKRLVLGGLVLMLVG